MKTVLIAVISFLAGAGAAWIFVGNVSQKSSDDLSKQLLVESSIDAIDSINGKDMATAELLLAAAVNSQIVIEKKNKTNHGNEWDRRMKLHNTRLGLTVGD